MFKAIRAFLLYGSVLGTAAAPFPRGFPPEKLWLPLILACAAAIYLRLERSRLLDGISMKNQAYVAAVYPWFVVFDVVCLTVVAMPVTAGLWCWITRFPARLDWTIIAPNFAV